MSATLILPCPHCEHPVIDRHDYSRPVYQQHACPRCGLRGPKGATYAETAGLWNSLPRRLNPEASHA